ncbi:hypothetical protein, conserved [Angomonas deanei]|uniref:Uncharacterized protein n=1 Tax=Angomonas deanei TaxID=59799 RepID=A0A7G2C844_9TRYP|nr:hypothetical protein, conserved [Angomonas deanei]
MNTRRKLVTKEAEKPSTTFHLMHESYHPLFQPKAISQVEDWYNLGASGPQRSSFRSICSEIYNQSTTAPPPTFSTQTESIMRQEECKNMLKAYAEVLSDEGKEKAKVWILSQSSTRRRDEFRGVFFACKAYVPPKSTQKNDYVKPDDEEYNVDRANFQKSVDWTDLKARKGAQELHQTGAGREAKRPSKIVEEQRRAQNPTARVTKPKNQFDQVNHLAALGYDDSVNSAEAIAELKRQHELNAESESYYREPETGATVYKAGAGKATHTAAKSDPHMMKGYTSEPMTQWNVKTL